MIAIAVMSPAIFLGRDPTLIPQEQHSRRDAWGIFYSDLSNIIQRLSCQTSKAIQLDWCLLQLYIRKQVLHVGQVHKNPGRVLLTACVPNLSHITGTTHKARKIDPSTLHIPKTRNLSPPTTLTTNLEEYRPASPPTNRIHQLTVRLKHVTMCTVLKRRYICEVCLAVLHTKQVGSVTKCLASYRRAGKAMCRPVKVDFLPDAYAYRSECPLCR